MVNPIESSVFLESVIGPFHRILDSGLGKRRTEAFVGEVRSTKACQSEICSAGVDEKIAMMLE